MLRSVDTWALRLCQYLPQGVKEEYTGIQSRNYGLKVNKVRGVLKLARQAAQNKQEYYIPPVKKRGATSKADAHAPQSQLTAELQLHLRSASCIRARPRDVSGIFETSDTYDTA